MQQSAHEFPHIHLASSTVKMMWSVHLALLPAIITLTYLQGSRWLASLIFAIICASAIEASMLFLRRRKHRIKITLLDGSASLTACLLTLSLPLTVPAWIIFIGVFFALIFGKHLYGGLGMNLFNPAMTGFCFLLISFPSIMGQHSTESFSLFTLFQNIDSTTSATLLDSSRQLRIDGASLSTLHANSKATVILSLAWTIGGIWLTYKRYIDWKIPVSLILSALITAMIFWTYDSQQYLSPITQLFSGAIIFGAFFIATDPVTASTTPLGRILFASLIGILTICIRNLGNFPDGFAFAVLLANSAAPILDNLQPTYR